MTESCKKKFLRCCENCHFKESRGLDVDWCGHEDLPLYALDIQGSDYENECKSFEWGDVLTIEE